MSDSSSCTLTIQSIFYENDEATVNRFLRALSCSLRTLDDKLVNRTVVRLGDCGRTPSITPECLRRAAIAETEVEYEHFQENLGHGGGHNRLFRRLETSHVLVINPDVALASDAIAQLFSRAAPDVGIVEARQVPLEHPKYADPYSGETGWASGACMLISGAALAAAGPFDPETFFLYGDDVDLSWRVRLAGFRVVFQPFARACHDKRLDRNGLVTSDTEAFYAAEASMLLPYKYSRFDVFEQNLHRAAASTEENHRRAVDSVNRRMAAGRMPAPIDPAHTVSYFETPGYTPFRFG